MKCMSSLTNTMGLNVEVSFNHRQPEQRVDGSLGCCTLSQPVRTPQVGSAACKATCIC